VTEEERRSEAGPADASPPMAGSAETAPSASASPPGADTTAPPDASAAPSRPDAPPAADAQVAAPESGSTGPAPAPSPERPTLIVRYGAMGIVGRFAHSLEHWRCDQQVVIKSDRGQEIGSVVCAWGGCGSPGGVPPQVRGEVLRSLTHADEVEARHLHESEQREFLFCRQRIRERHLPMKLVAVEHLFGGDRIIFYFVSETRVDFRALVRDLAHEFQTRIEMRQVGVRDEARLLGDFERCGRPLCCRAWIQELEPVSMKMAKVQKATLDPTKISGRCGRLMCCLRFEHTTYRDLAKNLPRRSTPVRTAQGPGKVLDTDVVSQKVAVLLDNGTRVNVPLAQLLPVEGESPSPMPPGPRPDSADDAAAETAPELVAGDVTARDAARRERREAASRASGAPTATETPVASEAPGAPAASVAPAAPSAPPGDGAAPSSEGASPGSRERRGRRRSRRGGRNRRRPAGGPAPGGPAGGGGPAPSNAPTTPPSGGPET